MKRYTKLFCYTLMLLLSSVVFSTQVAHASYDNKTAKSIKQDSKKKEKQQQLVALNKLKAHILEAERKTGVDATFIAAVLSIESNMGQNTKNPYSKVKGAMQYTNRTWNADRKKYAKQLGLPANVSVHNVRANILIGSAALADNRRYLEKVSGKKATPGDMYMAHFLGLGGAASVMKGKPNAPISRYVKLSKGNGNMFYVKGRVATVAQFRMKMNAKVANHGERYDVALNQHRADQFFVSIANNSKNVS